MSDTKEQMEQALSFVAREPVRIITEREWQQSEAGAAAMRQALEAMLEQRVACTESCLDCSIAFCDAYRNGKAALDTPAGASLLNEFEELRHWHESYEAEHADEVQQLRAKVLAMRNCGNCKNYLCNTEQESRCVGNNLCFWQYNGEKGAK